MLGKLYNFDFGSIFGSHSIDEKPQQSDFYMHAHEDYEIYYFLKGNAKYIVEGNEYQLLERDVLIMRPSEVHRLLIDSSQPYERMTINFKEDAFLMPTSAEYLLHPFINRELGQHNQYSSSNDGSEKWLSQLDAIKDVRCDLEFENIFINIKLMSFLSELIKPFETMIENNTYKNTKIIKVMDYINHNLCNDICIDSICNNCFLSKAQLNRIFKYSTGTSVWEYIKTKRLLMAKQMILFGQNPTQIYHSCGFQDYSTFYRAYKAKFGVSPSQHISQKR